MKQDKVKIVVAEDHNIVVEGIKTILALNSNLQFVGSADKEADLTYLLQKEDPKVLILDLNIGKINGFDLLEKVVADFPKLKVIILTMYNEPAFVRKAKSLGASAYLLKNYSGDELLDVIEQIDASDFYLSKGISITDDTKKEFDGSFAVTSQLSPKEIEIIKYVAKGLSSKDIADALFLSVHTVDTHRRNLLKKLRLNNTASLVSFAYENNIVDRN